MTQFNVGDKVKFKTKGNGREYERVGVVELLFSNRMRVRIGNWFYTPMKKNCVKL